MSIARHHTEWMNLIERSGPFLSLPILMRVFPQGLPKIEPDLVEALRLSYKEWRARAGGLTDQVAEHRRWIEFVLAEVLGFDPAAVAEGQKIPPTLKIHIAEHGQTLRPDLAILDGGRARLLINVVAPGQSLERALAGKRWGASPATRMMEQLLASGCPLGLATNGEQWMLVFVRPNEPAGFTTWHAEYWLEERLTLQAFRTLLGSARFYAASADETLDVLLVKSSDRALYVHQPGVPLAGSRPVRCRPIVHREIRWQIAAEQRSD